ncbi:MAG: hypothetical protein C0601_12595 [Candidatus Muiribacterium halophilum]|uniref:Leucine-binding protein domain-containing protein n=1 Tax=Muiribacterium halophilum TaxID=2053465 RepID=A0A2N5ZA75_MUIH1|nr:MAG: hypothetical protein C0601_12595 [Candidatus Muirbacterium halophilum]
MRTLHIMVFLLLSSVFFYACHHNQIDIGFIACISGVHHDLGNEVENGVLIACDEYNKATKGDKINLVIRDDKQNDNEIKKIIKEFSDKGIKNVLGPVTSSMAITMIETAPKDMFALSPTVSTHYLSGKEDNFFRIFTSQQNISYVIADSMINDSEDTTIIMDESNLAFSQSTLDTFRDEFEKKGGKIQQVITINSIKGVDYKRIMEDLLKKNPKTLFLIANPVDTAILCQHIRKNKLGSKIYLTNWSLAGDLFRYGGKAVNDVIFFLSTDIKGKSFQKFKEKYKKYYNDEPTFAASFGYEAMNVYISAIKENKQDESLKETILRISEFQGIDGKFKIDKYGDVKRKVYKYTIRDNDYLRLENN